MIVRNRINPLILKSIVEGNNNALVTLKQIRKDNYKKDLLFLFSKEIARKYLLTQMNYPYKYLTHRPKEYFDVKAGVIREIYFRS
jgi:hypothetical protein